jgi:hypothetical protein
MQVVRQILLVPNMVLDLLQGDTLHRIWLEHSINEVLDLRRKVIWNKVSTFLYLTEQLWHLVVIKW